MNRKRFELQAQQYEFPYHYIPHFNERGTPSLTRKLTWGLEYLCYQEHLKQKAIAMSPRSVLEVGCGDGFFIGGLPSEIPTRVGVDLSDRAIAFAKAFHPDCRFHVEDVRSITGVFDLVAAIEVIEHIHDMELPEFFQALRDKLAPDGHILLSVPTTVVPLSKKHYRHYTRQLLEQHLVQSGQTLRIVEVEYVYRQPSWEMIYKRLLNNRYFSLEIKSFTRLAWNRIWHKYRFAGVESGRHLVALLKST